MAYDVAYEWRKIGVSVAHAWGMRGANVAQIEQNRRFGRKNRKADWIINVLAISIASC